jgi:alkylhydroperoxidase/carboxymuconolactone decarboxylase family protein YurZ
MQQWDPEWAQASRSLAVHPVAVLGDRFAALVCIGLASACTALDGEATRRHIRAALEAGATREQIMFVVKCATVVSLHSLSVAAPLLVAETDVHAGSVAAPTPACDAIRAAGQWNSAWDSFANLDPEWTERFMTLGVDVYGAGICSLKEVELLSIALDASITHLYSPGILRHVRAALDAGASTAEIVAVLQLCVSQGVQSLHLAIPILHEELDRIP